jgi:hypothetical protein
MPAERESRISSGNLIVRLQSAESTAEKRFDVMGRLTEIGTCNYAIGSRNV